MPEYVRVRDKTSGYELSILASASRVGYEVLDEPATRRNGTPLPTSHKPSAPAEPPAPDKKHGRQAETQKEND